MGEEKKDFNYDITKTDLTWMKLALMIASRAEISEYAKEKPNVGCVIRRSSSKGSPAVLAVGWNGFLPKTPDDTLKGKAAEYFREGKKHGLTKEFALHAEANALRNCSENIEKATVYVTHVPCNDCAKQLVSHRVRRVFYLFWMDRSESSIKLFKEFDISCIPFPDSRRDDVLRDFSETFLGDHNICTGSTKQVIPEKDSRHLNTEDSRNCTSSDRGRFPRSPSDIDYAKLLREKQDEILNEIYQHRIKIVGVPEKSPEETALETSSLCVSLFREMGTDITIHEIDTAKRITKGRGSDDCRPIICKFVRQLARDSVMYFQQQACKVNPAKIGFPQDTDVSKISISDYEG